MKARGLKHPMIAAKGLNMSLHHLSDDLVLIIVPSEPHLCRKLSGVNEAMSLSGAGADVIVDFSHADWMSSASLSNLILLNKLLEENGRRLVLFGLSFESKCILRTAGLIDLFQIEYDQEAAVAILSAETP